MLRSPPSGSHAALALRLHRTCSRPTDGPQSDLVGLSTYRETSGNEVQAPLGDRAGFFLRSLAMPYVPFLLLLVVFRARARVVYEGKAGKINDGHTLTLLMNRKQQSIRYCDIITRAKETLWHQGEALGQIVAV